MTDNLTIENIADLGDVESVMWLRLILFQLLIKYYHSMLLIILLALCAIWDDWLI